MDRRRLLAVVALLVCHRFANAANMEYLRLLQNVAHNQALAQDRQWYALLHYQRGRLLRSPHSFQDAPDFFLSDRGKNDPHAELDATLAAFFSDGVDSDDDHPQCRFIARYRWLRSRLGFDSKYLPERKCMAFTRWLKKIDPRAITIIYASSFLNNPASLFGHTLMRIDSQHDPDTADLLDFAINYAAHTGGERGLWFAIKGLAGGYRGQYSTLHFDVMVKEYGDIENRDIWEYQLGLQPAEIERLLMHVWELKNAYFDYYFLDENCAFHLLALLEVARPSLHLTELFGTWVVPTDTIRYLVKVPGLISRVKYRPSRATVLQQRQILGGPSVNAAAFDIAQSADSSRSWLGRNDLTPEQQGQALELAEDYLMLGMATPGKHAPETLKRAYDLLTYRSRLAVPDQTPHVVTPTVRPDQGHKTSRLEVGMGFNDGTLFTQLKYRPVYHDLLDPQAGYAQGTQLQFLNVDVRAVPDTAELQLEHLDLVDMASLTPWDEMLRPISWRATVGIETRHRRKGQADLVGGFRGGLGLSKLLQRSVLAYTLVETSLEGDGSAPHYVDIGIGSVTGVFFDATERWRLGLEGQIRHYFVGTQTTDLNLALSQRLTITSDLAARMTIDWHREFGYEYLEGRVSLSVYF
jgi:hypothetical protein